MKLFISKLLLFRTHLCCRFLLCGIGLSLLCVSVQAQTYRWYKIDVSDNKVFYMDLESREKSSKKTLKTIWMKTVYPDQTSRLQQQRWNCEKREVDVLSLIFFDPQGNLLKYYTYETGNRMVVPPETVLENTYKAVCHPIPDENISTGQKNIIEGINTAIENTEIESINKDLIKVKVKLANIRQSSSIDAAVIGQAQRYAEFRLTGSKIGGWYQIAIADRSILLPQFRNTETAWIHGNTIEFIKAGGEK